MHQNLIIPVITVDSTDVMVSNPKTYPGTWTCTTKLLYSPEYYEIVLPVHTRIYPYLIPEDCFDSIKGHWWFWWLMTNFWKYLRTYVSSDTGAVIYGSLSLEREYRTVSFTERDTGDASCLIISRTRWWKMSTVQCTYRYHNVSVNVSYSSVRYRYGTGAVINRKPVKIVIWNFKSNDKANLQY